LTINAENWLKTAKVVLMHGKNNNVHYSDMLTWLKNNKVKTAAIVLEGYYSFNFKLEKENMHLLITDDGQEKDQTKDCDVCLIGRNPSQLITDMVSAPKK